VILALFSKSPYALQPWENAGYSCLNIDLEAEPGFRYGQEFAAFDLSDIGAAYSFIAARGIPRLIVSFPPCNDLAVSGARHFARKRANNPLFQQEAMNLFTIGETLAAAFNCPCLTENPVSVASTLYRPPDKIIHPYQYGGYLSHDDVHPEWPDYIAARDAYPKKTCYWLMNGLTIPPPKPVPIAPGYSSQYLKLGGKSAKTKTIRSMTPRGVFRAIYEQNSCTITQTPHSAVPLHKRGD